MQKQIPPIISKQSIWTIAFRRAHTQASLVPVFYLST